MPKLYELSENYRKMMEYVEQELENSEDMDEDTLDMFISTLESIEDSISAKTENIIKLKKNMEGDIEAFKAEEKRLNARRKALENRVESLKTYLADMLKNAGLTEVKAGVFTAKFQKSNPSVEIIDEKSIPLSYQEVVPNKILKAEIMKALKDGVEINGVKLVTDKKHLVIK